MRGLLLAATVIALMPLVLIIYYLLYKGLSAWSEQLLHHRSERQLLRQPRRDPQRDPRHARDRRAGDADLGPDRDRRRAVPDRVRQGLAFANVVRYFVDVMTGVPSIVFGLFIYIVLVISHAGGTGFAALEGLGRALAADAADRDPLRRGRAAARPRQPARGRAGARRAAVAGRDAGRAARRLRPGLVTGSLLAVARGMGETAPLLFTVSLAFGADRQPELADEHASGPDLHRHHQPAHVDRHARRGARR